MDARKITQALPMLGLPPSEERLLTFLVNDGYRNGWESRYADTLDESIALRLGLDRSWVGKARRALVERKLVIEGKSRQGRPTLKLSPATVKLCQQVLFERQIRITFGKSWWRIVKHRDPMEVYDFVLAKLVEYEREMGDFRTVAQRRARGLRSAVMEAKYHFTSTEVSC